MVYDNPKESKRIRRLLHTVGFAPDLDYSAIRNFMDEWHTSFRKLKDYYLDDPRPFRRNIVYITCILADYMQVEMYTQMRWPKVQALVQWSENTIKYGIPSEWM